MRLKRALSRVVCTIPPILGGVGRCAVKSGWKALRASLLTIKGSISLQLGLLLVNFCLYKAAKKTLQRARFATAVRLLTDLDERDLRFILQHLPAWVKFDDFERAKFLDDSLAMLWPAIDRALCSVLREVVEPEMRANAPAAVGGLRFSELSLGHEPPRIMGVRPRTVMERGYLAVDIDVRWAGTPELGLIVTPSKQFLLQGVKIGKVKVLPEINMTPLMNVSAKIIQFQAIVRLSFSPVLLDLPLVGGLHISFLERPKLDFDIRLKHASADIMSIPALSDWITTMIDDALGEMTWPKQLGIPFLDEEKEEELILAPKGIVTVEILEARIPPRTSRVFGTVKKARSAYAVASLEACTPEGELGADRQVRRTAVARTTLEPKWTSEKFLMVVFDKHKLVKIQLWHSREPRTSAVGSSAVGSSDQDRRSAKLLGRVDIPLKALGAVSAEPGMRLSEALLGAIQPGSQGSQAGTDSRRPSATGSDGQPLDGAGDASEAGTESLRTVSEAMPEVSAGSLDGLDPRLGRSRSAPEEGRAGGQGGGPGLQPEPLRTWTRLTALAEAEEGVELGPDSPPGEVPPQGSPLDGTPSGRQLQRLTQLSRAATQRQGGVEGSSNSDTASEAASACTCDGGAWLPLIPVTSTSILPTWATTTSSTAGAGASSVGAQRSTYYPSLELLNSLVASSGHSETSRKAVAGNVKGADGPSHAHAKSDEELHTFGSTLSSFFDWHAVTSSSDSGDLVGRGEAKKPFLQRVFGSETSSTGGVEDSLHQGGASGAAEQLEKGKSSMSEKTTGIAGMVRVRLGFQPVMQHSAPTAFYHPPDEKSGLGEPKPAVGVLVVLLKSYQVLQTQKASTVLGLRITVDGQVKHVGLTAPDRNGSIWLEDQRLSFGLYISERASSSMQVSIEVVDIPAKSNWRLSSWLSTQDAEAAEEDDSESKVIGLAKILVSDVVRAGRLSKPWRLMPSGRPEISDPSTASPCGELSCKLAWFPVV